MGILCALRYSFNSPNVLKHTYLREFTLSTQRLVALASFIVLNSNTVHLSVTPTISRIGITARRFITRCSNLDLLCNRLFFLPNASVRDDRRDNQAQHAENTRSEDKSFHKYPFLLAATLPPIFCGTFIRHSPNYCNGYLQ